MIIRQAIMNIYMPAHVHVCVSAFSSQHHDAWNSWEWQSRNPFCTMSAIAHVAAIGLGIAHEAATG